MTNAHIHQIYYSESTRLSLAPQFIPLDNGKNERPDWREYWPIRNFLLNHRLEDGSLYGFLSPSFTAKTRLSSATVLEFIGAHGEADVILFSPFFDQIAFFLNQWEQGALAHRNVEPAFEEALTLVAPDFQMYGTVSSSKDSVFCNYFAAKPPFWAEWFRCCEKVFECAERADSALGRALAQDTRYKEQPAPTKVFIIERVASALLATQRNWTVATYNPFLLPFSSVPISALGAELAALDALKIAYQTEPRAQYKQAFFNLRARFASDLRKSEAQR